MDWYYPLNNKMTDHFIEITKQFFLDVTQHFSEKHMEGFHKTFEYMQSKLMI